MHYYYWSLLYSAILRSWADSLRSYVILHEWIAFYSAFFEYPPKWCIYSAGMAGATWNCCRLGAFCVHHTTMHHVTSRKATYIRSIRNKWRPNLDLILTETSGNESESETIINHCDTFPCEETQVLTSGKSIQSTPKQSHATKFGTSPVHMWPCLSKWVAWILGHSLTEAYQRVILHFLPLLFSSVFCFDLGFSAKSDFPVFFALEIVLLKQTYTHTHKCL